MTDRNGVIDYLQYGKKQALITAYLASAFDGYWSIMQRCLQKDPTIKEALDRKNRTAAAIAVEYNHMKVLVGLLDGNFLATGERVRDICFLAASRGRLNLVKAIFSRSIPEGMDTDGKYHHVLCVSAAHGATLHGHTDIVQWVAKRTPLRDLIDDSGNTLLMMTHAVNNNSTLEWILDHGNIDIHHTNNRYRMTALAMALMAHNHGAMKVLLIKGRANVEDRYFESTIFFAALDHHAYEMVKWLILEGGQDVNARTRVDNVSTALLILAQRGEALMVEWMVDVGKADTTCLSSNRVFYSLLEHKNLEVMEWLMVNGHVDANMMVDGEPAFFHVARKSAFNFLMNLLDSGEADDTKVARDGTSVWLAVNWNYLLDQEMKGREFISVVAPRLEPPEEIVRLLSSHKYLSGWLDITKTVRKKVITERQRRFDAMKDRLPPNVLRNIIMEYDTMTTHDMYQLMEI
jgi:hypothetical protein